MMSLSSSLLASPRLFGAIVVVTALVCGTGCPDPVTPSPEPAPGVEPGAEPGVEPEPSPDGGVTDAGAADAGAADAGQDGGTVGPVDGGPVDAGAVDGGGPLDAGANDAGPTDGGAPVVDAGPPQNVCVAASEGPPFQISQKAQVRWKRDRVVERDLMAAFDLDATQVCAELGAAICFSSIHRVPLGGHEPVVSAMYEGIASPGATTPISFDRVVLSACGARVDLDAVEHIGDGTGGFGSAVLYRHYRLDAPSLDSDSPEVAQQITDLYRRVLARDPTRDEVIKVASLADAEGGDTPDARDFSKMACYAVTSTAEFLFQ